MRRLLVCVGVLAAGTAWAYANGVEVVGKSGKDGPTCKGCHSATMPTLAITVTGPASVKAGSVNNYTIKVPAPGGTLIVSGIAVAANGGATLEAGGTNLKLASGELVHSAANPLPTDYIVKLTAPNVNGTVTLFAAAAACNGASPESSDAPADAKLDITVTGAVGGGTDGGTSSDGGTGGPGAVNPNLVMGGCSTTGGVPLALLSAALLFAGLRSRRASPRR